MMIINGIVGIWKEAVVTYLNILYVYTSTGFSIENNLS
jgi:hypothetical protein